MYKCFACGASGGAINFVKEFEQITYTKAIVKLAQSVGIEITNFEERPLYNEEEQALINVFKEATTFYMYLLDLNQDKVKAYLNKRSLNKQALETFQIGLAYPGFSLNDFLQKKHHNLATLINASLVNSVNEDFFQNRLIFPITNTYGDVVAFSARALRDQDVKYINSVESRVFQKSKLLYNYFLAKDEALRLKEIYICEGQMDVIALSIAKIPNAVATLGVALTRSHLSLLQNLKVILNFDLDEAGVNASLKTIRLLLENNFSVEVIKPSDHFQFKDASETLSASGPEALKDMLESSRVKALEFAYEFFIKKVSNSANLEQIKAFFSSFDTKVVF